MLLFSTVSPSLPCIVCGCLRLGMLMLVTPQKALEDLKPGKPVSVCIIRLKSTSDSGVDLKQKHSAHEMFSPLLKHLSSQFSVCFGHLLPFRLTELMSDWEICFFNCVGQMTFFLC